MQIIKQCEVYAGYCGSLVENKVAKIIEFNNCRRSLFYSVCLLFGIASASTMTLGTCAGKIKIAWCKSDDSALLYTSLGSTKSFILDKNSGHIKKISITKENGYKWEASFQPENYWLFTVTANGVSSTYSDGECTTTMPISQRGSSKDCKKHMQSYNVYSRHGKN